MKAHLCMVLLLTACVSSTEDGQDASLGATKAAGDQPSNLQVLSDETPKTDAVDPWNALSERVADYEKIKSNARTRGVVIGVIRGTLLGAIVGGEHGAVFGAVVSGGLGLAVADSVASSLIQEHKNYLIQRNSIEAVIAAAQADTLAIQKDVDLLKTFSRDVGRKDHRKSADLTVERQKLARAEVIKLVTYAEERTRNLLLVMAMVEAHGSNLGPLQIEQKKQTILHQELRQAKLAMMNEVGDPRS